MELRFLDPSNTNLNLLDMTTDIGLTTLGRSVTFWMHPSASNLSSSKLTNSGASLANRLLGNREGEGALSLNTSLYPSLMVETMYG